MRLVPAGLTTLVLLATANAQLAPPPADRVPARTLVEELQGSLGASPPAGARPINSITVELIKHFEGWSAEAYDDPAGYCTIGFGHLIALKLCRDSDVKKYNPPLDTSEGERILEEDTRSARVVVQESVKVALNAAQFGALVSFTFNVGKGNFARSSLLRFINSGRNDLAEQEFARWVQAGGKTLPGLSIRRACEQMLFTGRLKLDAQGAFNRNACYSLGITPSTTFLIDIDRGEF